MAASASGLKRTGKRKNEPENHNGKVQGIASSLAALTIKGEKLLTHIGGDLLTGTITRTISGATTLELSILDSNRRLLNSDLLEEVHHLELDGLGFAFVKVSSAGRNEPLILTYEPNVVARLRRLKGPQKAFRDKITRAEFAKRLVRRAPGPTIPFVCPELELVQPIKSAREGRKAKQEATVNKGRGISQTATHLTVKGVAATASQKEVGERALRVAESMKAPPKAMAALIVTLAVESVFGAASHNWVQMIPSTAAEAHADPNDLEASCHAFLDGYFGPGTGAIHEANANPEKKVYEIAQAVQASGAGKESNGAANYGPWVDEAWEWVKTMGGGDLAGLHSEPEFQRYAFEEKKNEDVWACTGRLASEVHWRRFESAGRIYFMTEPDLLAAMQRFKVTDFTPGVEDTSFDYDVGKSLTEMTVSARARAWTAPPGTVCAVEKHGPADGNYLVTSITAPLTTENALIEIVLHKPTEPLPEPAPKPKAKKKGKSLGAPGGGPSSHAGVPPAIGKMLDEIERLNDPKVQGPYLYGGNHVNPPPSSGRYDCSSYVSRILYVGGWIGDCEASPALMSWGEAGEGEWLTIYAGLPHVMAKINNGKEWKFFGTSGSNPNGKGGWMTAAEGALAIPGPPRHRKGM